MLHVLTGLTLVAAALAAVVFVATFVQAGAGVLASAPGDQAFRRIHLSSGWPGTGPASTKPWRR